MLTTPRNTVITRLLYQPGVKLKSRPNTILKRKSFTNVMSTTSNTFSNRIKCF